MKKRKKTEISNEEINISTNPLSEDELEMFKASHDDTDRNTLPHYDNSDFAKAKRFAKKNIFSVVFVCITIVLLIAVIAILGFMLFKAFADAPSKDDYSVTMGDDEFMLSYKDYTEDKVFYFDVCKIASYAELVVSGSAEKIKITCPDGTYIRIEKDKDIAIVNGIDVFLDGKAKIIEQSKDSAIQCLIPFSSIQKLFSFSTEEGTSGMLIKFSDEDNTVVIKRMKYADSGKFLPISFSPDCFDIATDAQLSLDKELFSENTSACVKQILLINKNNPLGESYIPEGLVSLNELGCPVVEGRDFFLCEDAARSLTLMLNDMNKAVSGKDVLVTSAYRSFVYQRELFAIYISDLMEKGMTAEQAIAELTRTSAFPGESEHQSGLCVDLIEKGELNLSESFGETAAFAWLCENAHKYGFILRYPENKNEITGYDYEPWHYRFVGINTARIIHEENMCLEEFLAKI